VIQLVAHDGVLLREQGLEEATVGVEARRVENRVLGSQELAEFSLQLLVDLLRPADESDGREPVPPPVEGGLGRGDDLGVIGEAQVVVRAEIQHLPVLDGDPGPLGARQEALPLPQAFGADGLQLRREMRA
jgi:hypothetical protein